MFILGACAPTAPPSPPPEVTPTPTPTPAPTPEPAPTPTPTPPPAPTPSKPHFTSDDGRIEFALDNVERTKVWPAELQGERTPEEGYDFVIIDVIIVRIKDGHVQGRRGSAIVSDDGVEYQEASSTWKGVKFNDPQSLTASYELIEGATGKFAYELPEEVQPARLRLAYLFFESWGESWQPEGEEERYIDIILS